MSHVEITTQLIKGWMENAGCDRATAEIRADLELGSMHEAETCPVCFPPCKGCRQQWYLCHCEEPREVAGEGPPASCGVCGGPYHGQGGEYACMVAR